MPEQDPSQPNPIDVQGLLEQTDIEISAIQTPEDVDNRAFDILDSMPYAQELLTRIIDAPKDHEDSAAIKERAKMHREISIELSLISGVEIDAAEHETQRAVYKSQLDATLQGIDPEASPEEMMLKLGMIRPVEGARGHIFTFPSRLFPPYIKDQWKAYIGMIEQFDSAQEKYEKRIITNSDFVAIDGLRKRAHDGLSESIGDLLALPGWELENYRKLVAKMRDEKFAEPKGEMVGYVRDFRKRSAGGEEHLTRIQRTLGQHAAKKAGGAASSEHQSIAS